MNLFHRIDDAQAIVRTKTGVFKQTELYSRGDRLYVKHAGGFARIDGHNSNGESWGTSSPSLSVIDLPDLLDVDFGGKWGVPIIKKSLQMVRSA